MATSGTRTFNPTRDEIITEAYKILEIGVEGEPLDPDQLKSAITPFNMLIKHLQTKGLQQWTRGTNQFNFIADTYTYLLGPTGNIPQDRPLQIIECSRVDSNGNRTPLTRIARQEFEALPNKTQAGVPTVYNYDPALTLGVLQVWPQPTVTEAAEYQLDIVYFREVEDVGAGTDTIEYPSYWGLALSYQLAKILAPRVGYPINERYLLNKQAAEFLDDALSFDSDNDSLYLQPNFEE